MKRFFSHFPGLGGDVRRRNLASRGKQQGNRVLGGRDRVAERRVHDHDAARGGRGDVDVVDADTGATDHLESRGGGNDVLVRLRRGSYGQAVVAPR